MDLLRPSLWFTPPRELLIPIDALTETKEKLDWVIQIGKNEYQVWPQDHLLLELMLSK